VTAFSIVDVGVAKVIRERRPCSPQEVEDFEGMFMAAHRGRLARWGPGAAAMQTRTTSAFVDGHESGAELLDGSRGLKVKFTPKHDSRRRGSEKPLKDSRAAAPRTTQ